MTEQLRECPFCGATEPPVPVEVREAIRRLADIVKWVRAGDKDDEADVAAVRAWLASRESQPS